jgi:8-oxo-dGTP diphosphatase
MTEEKPVIRTAVGIIRDEDRFIVAKRDDKGDLPGMWEFPGGIIDETTSPEEALKDHLVKKFNIDVVVGDKIGTTTHDHDFGTVELSAYHVECISKKIKLAEHLAYRKIKLNMFKDFDMVPVAQPIVDLLKQQS